MKVSFEKVDYVKMFKPLIVKVCNVVGKYYDLKNDFTASVSFLNHHSDYWKYAMTSLEIFFITNSDDGVDVATKTKNMLDAIKEAASKYEYPICEEIVATQGHPDLSRKEREDYYKEKGKIAPYKNKKKVIYVDVQIPIHGDIVSTYNIKIADINIKD